MTAVTGFESDKAVFLNGKLLLAGDALTQCRPHLGSSCNLPALQALALLRVLKEEVTIAEWEKQVVSFAKEFAIRSAAAGQFGMTGRYPEGYTPLYKVSQSN